MGGDQVLREALDSGRISDEPAALMSIPADEGRYLQHLIGEHRPKITLEIGCAFGISSLFICEALRDVVLRRLGVLYAAMALPIVVLNALLLPPIQGVDENTHFLRAVWLSYGRILGERQSELVVGGRINQAAVTIANGFERMKFRPTTKLDRAQYAAARELRWKGQPKVFAGFHTVIYPPFFYLPSVAAIWFGRVLNLRVIDTLIAARIANGIVCVLLGAIAVAIAVQGRAIMFAILSLPMTLDLFGAVSPEGSIIAVLALFVAIFCLSSTSAKRSLAARVAGSAALGAIAASKPPFIAFCLLLAGSSLTDSEAAWGARARRFLVSCAPALVVFGLWFGFGAVPYKVPFLPDHGVSSPDQVQFLLHHPLAVIGIVGNTFHIYGVFWGEAFVGVLGWLDTWLPTKIYLCAALALLIALSLDLMQDEVIRPAADRILAGMALIGAIALSLLSLYITWTKVGADFIDGFQGRHLTAPALLLSIIVPNHVRRLGVGSRVLQGVGWVVLLALIWTCELAVPVVLSSRYYWS